MTLVKIIITLCLVLGKYEHCNSLLTLNDNFPGIMSLHISQDARELEIFAGTKRGTIQRLVLLKDDKEISMNVKDEALLAYSSLPIFSLEVIYDKDKTYLCSGGGDRYISIWEKKASTTKWEYTQRLGPHTGWVKDILWDPFSRKMHSIGCNCIERWERSNDGGGDTWKHESKSSIESSVNMGFTLSSDLLCLCPCLPRMFFSGAVDGRIHLWKSSDKMLEEVSSIAAHTGRVNALAYVPQTDLLFSGSHDGTIKCWVLNESFKIKMAAVVTIGDEEIRVTSLAVIKGDETDSTVKVVYGTQKGNVGVFSVIRNGENATISDLKVIMNLDQGSAINALSVIPNSKVVRHSYTILIGHSLGLTTCKFLPE